MSKFNDEVMFRIKTTTSKGNVFYSPLVYEEDVLIKKVERMGWLVKHKKAKMEIIEVTNYPKAAIHDWMVQIRDREHDLPHFMRLVEEKWRKLNNKCEFYPTDGDAVCGCNSDISGKFICTEEYSLGCQWANERRESNADNREDVKEVEGRSSTRQSWHKSSG